LDAATRLRSMSLPHLKEAKTPLGLSGSRPTICGSEPAAAVPHRHFDSIRSTKGPATTTAGGTPTPSTSRLIPKSSNDKGDPSPGAGVLSPMDYSPSPSSVGSSFGASSSSRRRFSLPTSANVRVEGGTPSTGRNVERGFEPKPSASKPPNPHAMSNLSRSATQQLSTPSADFSAFGRPRASTVTSTVRNSVDSAQTGAGVAIAEGGRPSAAAPVPIVGSQGSKEGSPQSALFPNPSPPLAGSVTPWGHSPGSLDGHSLGALETTVPRMDTDTLERVLVPSLSGDFSQPTANGSGKPLRQQSPATLSPPESSPPRLLQDIDETFEPPLALDDSDEEDSTAMSAFGDGLTSAVPLQMCQPSAFDGKYPAPSTSVGDLLRQLDGLVDGVARMHANLAVPSIV